MNKIGPFTLYKKTPNDIHYGSIYTSEVELPILYSPKRTIRIYLPEDFDKNKKYPLLIMADGQNIVDKYTSAFGAWSIDVREHEHLLEGHSSFIVLGIDSPKDPLYRAMEYSFPFIKMNPLEEGKELLSRNVEFESHLLYRYIALELLPFVRKYFPILEDKRFIGVGGSSMGGVFSLSLLTSYPEIFGYALIFSPGIFLYSDKEVKAYLNKSIDKLDKSHKLYFYSGNIGFESKFLERTVDAYNFYKLKGLTDSQIRLCIDEKGEHNEATWSAHFIDAIKFWLGE